MGERVLTDMPTGGALVAALMRDGPDFKQGYSFANALIGVAERESISTATETAVLARDAVLTVIGQHGCFISELDEARINVRRNDFDDEFDNADLALRTCMCGEKLDGFDEYTSHLRQVFSERG